MNTTTPLNLTVSKLDECCSFGVSIILYYSVSSIDFLNLHTMDILLYIYCICDCKR
jgi:hypothetical protein